MSLVPVRESAALELIETPTSNHHVTCLDSHIKRFSSKFSTLFYRKTQATLTNENYDFICWLFGDGAVAGLSNMA